MEDDCDSVPTPPRWYTFARSEGFPTIYPPQFTPAHVDVFTAGLILAFLIITFCFFLILPAYRSTRRWPLLAYLSTSLFIGGIVVVGNYGHEWEVGRVRIKTPYRAGTHEEIKADLGLHIALRGVNITLKANPKDLAALHDLRNETIDYNEHFSWEWRQGRFGFGQNAGRISRDFREATLRGTPFPILQVAEYFTFDGEGIRFGRHYRQAGWYSHIMMWAAFPTWLLANILFCMTVNGGALFLNLTGIFQLIAILIWSCLRNPIELGIPFESPPSDDGKPLPEVILATKFGIDYYLVLINALLCIILSVVTFVANELDPDGVCQFFGIDPSTNFDEYYGNDPASDSKEPPKEPMDPEMNSAEKDDAGGLRQMQHPMMRSATLKRRTKLSTSIRKRVDVSFRQDKPAVKPRKSPLAESSVRYDQTSAKATITEENETFPLIQRPGHN